MQRGRLKRLVNFSERRVSQLVGEVAGKHGATVAHKVRVADVVEIANSGFSNALYRYALQAHFDVVVYDGEEYPLFAVEFDGPTHQDEDSRRRDEQKNEICDALCLPLARLTDDHLTARGAHHGYVEWLAEVFFANKALLEAQQQGHLPLDEPVDPMAIVTDLSIGDELFPLHFGARARRTIAGAARAGAIGQETPWYYAGIERGRGVARSVAVVSCGPGSLVVGASRAYVSGFGISSADAAQELAVVSLASRLSRGTLPITSNTDFRARLVRLLQSTSTMMTGCPARPGVDFGFRISYGSDGWKVGVLGDQPEVCIPRGAM